MTTYAKKKEKFIEKHGELAQALLKYYKNDLYTADDKLKFDYIGDYKSISDFAESYVKANYKIPKVLTGCIDWGKVAEHMKNDKFILAIELSDIVHVFRGEYLLKEYING